MKKQPASSRQGKRVCAKGLRPTSPRLAFWGYPEPRVEGKSCPEPGPARQRGAGGTLGCSLAFLRDVQSPSVVPGWGGKNSVVPGLFRPSRICSQGEPKTTILTLKTEVRELATRANATDASVFHRPPNILGVTFLIFRCCFRKVMKSRRNIRAPPIHRCLCTSLSQTGQIFFKHAFTKRERKKRHLSWKPVGA